MATMIQLLALFDLALGLSFGLSAGEQRPKILLIFANELLDDLLA